MPRGVLQVPYVPIDIYCKTNCETFVRVDRLNASHKLAVLL